jgi:hypothetical protein
VSESLSKVIACVAMAILGDCDDQRSSGAQARYEQAKGRRKSTTSRRCWRAAMFVGAVILDGAARGLAAKMTKAVGAQKEQPDVGAPRPSVELKRPMPILGWASAHCGRATWTAASYSTWRGRPFRVRAPGVRS